LKNEKDIVDEVRSFFGTGTNLQELYINPERMTPATWDALSEAATWAAENADVLADTHAIGGDPEKGEVYGWASWCKRKAILVLRNPAEEAASLTLDIGEAFELPEGAARRYALKSPWEGGRRKKAVEVVAGKAHVFELGAFEVMVLDATPRR